MNRRDFFGVGAALGVGVSVLPALGAQTFVETDKRDCAKLRISSQTGPAPGNSLEEKL